ncbi:MAG: hypothetical protein GF355_01065 [Candidatus Eisenbacteria bacterium]|nr:hypothetical protein [Candidatus Eisenbacteria bacterium]
MTHIRFTIGIVFLVAGLWSCGGQTPSEVTDLPDMTTVDAHQLSEREGYEKLEQGDLEAAIADFDRMRELIPASPYGDYHAACRPEELARHVRRAPELNADLGCRRHRVGNDAKSRRPARRRSVN